MAGEAADAVTVTVAEDPLLQILANNVLRATDGKQKALYEAQMMAALSRVQNIIDVKTLSENARNTNPEPPVQVNVQPGTLENTLLVTWLPVTISFRSQTAQTSSALRAAAPLGYRVYIDGHRVIDVHHASCIFLLSFRLSPIHFPTSLIRSSPFGNKFRSLKSANQKDTPKWLSDLFQV